MNKLPAIAIYGYSDSGKTTVLTDLVEKLTESGHGVCTVKHTPADVSLDSEGKDTRRHVDSGSSLTVFSTGVETDLMFPEPLPLNDILRLVGSAGSCDLVLVEGFKSSSLPKISVGDIEGKDGTIMRYDGDLDPVLEAIESEIRITEIENELPGLDCGLCGNESCREMAEEIYEGKREVKDCQVLEEKDLNLRVDGEDIPLENFPASIIKSGLKGMLESLKGVDDDFDHVSLEADY